MNLRRFLAAATAAAVVTSVMAVTSFAASEEVFSGTATVKSTGGWWDAVEPSMSDLIGDVDPATIDSIAITAENAAKFLYNYSADADAKTIDIAAGETVEITDMLLDPDFYWCAFAVSTDDATYVANFEWTVTAEVADAPVDDAPADDGDDTIVDDGADDGDDAIVDDGAEDGDDTIVDDGADDVAPEADWSLYDADAMAALNADFVFGTTDQIDIYALVGDNWPNLAKIEGTFVWTDLATGWCGGCGIGNGAVMTDGSSWLQGVEFGAANANAAVVGDGVATQTMIDITENPIASLATYDEKTGETSFGRFFIQNWWNGVESGAQLAALTAYDAEGNVIGEIQYMDDIPTADDTTGDDAANDDATGDTSADTDDGKGSADTGVEGVAAVAGVVALAGVAVVAARKRK